MYPTQLSPIVKGLSLKNRIVMCSLTRSRGVAPTQVHIDYYTQRAGAGLILTEGTLIEPQGGEWSHAPGIFSKTQIAGWKNVTDAVHAKGGKMFLQLWHLGRVSHPHLQSGMPNVAPSAIAAKGGKFRALEGAPGYVTPVAIEDPEEYIQLYRRAAINAKAAGFDGVELHSANGYLPNQFLEEHSNHRNDRWGGSIENRCRFNIEIIKNLIEIFGPKMVGIKISPGGGYNDMGDSIESATETYSYLITELDKLNIGYIQVSRYLKMMDYTGRGNKIDIEVFRPFIKNSIAMINGSITPEEAEQLLTRPDHPWDLVSIGRPFITNPDYVERLQQEVALNSNYDYSTFYGNNVEDFAKGYSDWPTATK